MLNIAAVSPFLHLAYEDEDPTNRLAAIHILTRLPLSDDAWRAVAGAASNCLGELEASSGLDASSLTILAAVPVRSVRARLGEIAHSPGHPANLECSLALARQGDPAGVGTLMGALAESGGEDIARRLACLALEHLDVDRKPFEQALHGDDPIVRFWAAVALARLGEVEPLEQVFDAILDQEGWGGGPSHPLFPEVPPLFWGDPWTPYDALAAARPLPVHLYAFLVGLYQSEFARVKEREGPGAKMPRDAAILVGGLTGIVDVYGEPLEEHPEKPARPTVTAADAARAEAVAERLLAQPWRDPVHPDVDWEDLASLSALSPERAGQVMTAALSALEVAAQEWKTPTPGDEIVLNNSLLDLACALPRPIRLPLGELVQLYARNGSSLPSAALNWTLARAGAEAMTADLGPRILAAEGEERGQLLAWAEAIANKLGAPAPFAGAGPAAAAGAPAMGRVVDDFERAVARLPRSAAGGLKGFGYVGLSNLDLGELLKAPVILPPGAEEEASEEASAGTEPPQPSRTAWPHLWCDDIVAVGVPFPLEVGIAPQRDEKLEGTGTMALPTGPFKLEIELMLDSAAFALVEGKRCFSLRVTDKKPYPRRTVKLVALGGEALKGHRHIGVTYKADGVMRGYASREVSISGLAVPSAPPPAPEAPKKTGGIDMSPFLATNEADLTIVIRHGDDAAGQTLVFSACSPMVAIRNEEEAPSVDIGASPDKFSETIVRKASTTADPFLLYDWLAGRGKLIAGKLPGMIRQALRDVAAKAAENKRAATVLIISEDPYIPWELAVLEPGLPAPGCASPFLGAQVVLGRWVLSPDRPPPRPPRQVTVREQAVVSGSYDGVLGWRQLPNAEEEARTLINNWPPAHGVSASYDSVRQCLRGREPADSLHFALHGQFDSSGLQSGLVLVGHRPDRPDVAIPQFLEPDHVRSGDLSTRKPFVFLNACQVAAGQAVLGDYAGMAAAFLFAGASAVVAPLWSIDDGQARDIALAFYDRAYKDNVPPAEILRSERARYCESALTGAGAVSGTHLAYQFFGHPLFVLTRA